MDLSTGSKWQGMLIIIPFNEDWIGSLKSETSRHGLWLEHLPRNLQVQHKTASPSKKGPVCIYVYMYICKYIYIYNVYIPKYIDACIHTLHYITLIHTYIHVRIPTPGNYIGQHQKTASTIQNQCFWGYAWNPTDIQMTFGGLTFSWLGYTNVYIICNISNSMYCIK